MTGKKIIEAKSIKEISQDQKYKELSKYQIHVSFFSSKDQPRNIPDSPPFLFNYCFFTEQKSIFQNIHILGGHFRIPEIERKCSNFSRPRPNLSGKESGGKDKSKQKGN